MKDLPWMALRLKALLQLVRFSCGRLDDRSGMYCLCVTIPVIGCEDEERGKQKKSAYLKTCLVKPVRTFWQFENRIRFFVLWGLHNKHTV